MSYALYGARMTNPKPGRVVDPKGGRPPKAREKRTRVVTVRYTPTEYARVCRYARGESVSDYIRESSLNRQRELDL